MLLQIKMYHPCRLPNLFIYPVIIFMFVKIKKIGSAITKSARVRVTTRVWIKVWIRAVKKKNTEKTALDVQAVNVVELNLAVKKKQIR